MQSAYIRLVKLAQRALSPRPPQPPRQYRAPPDAEVVALAFGYRFFGVFFRKFLERLDLSGDQFDVVGNVDRRASVILCCAHRFLLCITCGLATLTTPGAPRPG